MQTYNPFTAKDSIIKNRKIEVDISSHLTEGLSLWSWSWLGLILGRVFYWSQLRWSWLQHWRNHKVYLCLPMDFTLMTDLLLSYSIVIVVLINAYQSHFFIHWLCIVKSVHWEAELIQEEREVEYLLKDSILSTMEPFCTCGAGSVSWTGQHPSPGSEAILACGGQRPIWDCAVSGCSEAAAWLYRNKFWLVVFLLLFYSFLFPFFFCLLWYLNDRVSLCSVCGCVKSLLGAQMINVY